MQKTELAQAREAACRSLLQEVRTIEAAARTGFPGRRLLETMLAFAERHGTLFPDADFDPPRADGRVHPLSNGLDTPYGLYPGATRPGKEAAPHCHGCGASASASLASDFINSGGWSNRPPAPRRVWRRPTRQPSAGERAW